MRRKVCKKITKDFWMLVRGIMAAEYSGEATVKKFADQFRVARTISTRRSARGVIHWVKIA
mgnify:CR=1 FL=1